MALTKIITDTIDLSSDTTALKMPKGTTAQRPAAVDSTIGETRENTTTGKMEIYTGAKGWRALQQTGQDTGVVGTNNFDTIIYSNSGSTPAAITGLNFQPDLTWVKSRDYGYPNILADSVRGLGNNKMLISDFNGEEGSTDASYANCQKYGYISSLDINGFGVTSGTGAGSNGSYVGANGLGDYVSWNWKAGGAATTIGAGTVGNDIASEVSVNTAAGFSIVKYTATLLSAGNLDVAHGLGTAPEIIISKSLTTTAAWRVRPFFLNNSAYNYLELNNTNAIADLNISDGTMAMPTANVFSNNWNGSIGGAADIIAYCWTSIPGYSLIGSYTGTGSATDFPIIYTGFAPAWLMIKRTDSTGNWCIYDNKRDTTNPNNAVLAANSANAQSYYASGYEVNFYNNGFQIAVGPSVDINTAGGDYIFMCFAS